MKSRKVFAEVVNHFICNIRQVQYLASQYLLGKSNNPRQAPCNIYTELGDYASRAIDQLRKLTDQQVTSTME